MDDAFSRPQSNRSHLSQTYNYMSLSVSGNIRNALAPSEPPPRPPDASNFQPLGYPPPRQDKLYYSGNSSYTSYFSSFQPKGDVTPPPSADDKIRVKRTLKPTSPPVTATELAIVSAIREQQSWKERSELTPLLGCLAQLSHVPLLSENKADVKKDLSDFENLIQSTELAIDRYAAAIGRYCVAFANRERDFEEARNEKEAQPSVEKLGEKLDESKSDLKSAIKQKQNLEEYEKASKRVMKNVSTEEASKRLNIEKANIFKLRQELSQSARRLQRKVHKAQDLMTSIKELKEIE